ncbi:acyl-coenzyme A thioesterase PaaI-like protein [Pseudonocardia endophytica]|uniref:Acyl-coenzyme A thioesterase PaaI-like protein n=2 Tax=Pseudonocardia endophytica TaxID=401976 RepID=A0A4R1HWV9_PSEEN|nr:acyl-coenzyme A thioesterase PaaI-like protein [Pseudonocardia endophytica]
MAAAELLGIELVTDTADATDAPDQVVCRLRIGESHLNQGLIGHGGVLFTLADTAVGLLANPPDLGETWVGTSFHVQLLRGAGLGDVVVATAVRESRSRRLQACTARLTRERDGAFLGTVGVQLIVAPPDPYPAASLTGERPATADEPLYRALAEAARRDGHPPPEPANDARVLYDGDRPVGLVAGDYRWTYPRWRTF